MAGEFGEKVPVLPSQDGGAVFRVIEFSPEGPWIDTVGSSIDCNWTQFVFDIHLVQFPLKREENKEEKRLETIIYGFSNSFITCFVCSQYQMVEQNKDGDDDTAYQCNAPYLIIVSLNKGVMTIWLSPHHS